MLGLPPFGTYTKGGCLLICYEEEKESHMDAASTLGNALLLIFCAFALGVTAHMLWERRTK
jgi:hypothetical protein